MTIPADYNAVTMSMTPSEISDTATALTLGGDEVISALNVINSTLSALELGWAGSTATEAKDFIDQWLAAMTNLFGSSSKASGGVLNQAIVALATAAGNYSGAEQAVVSMFTSLSSSLSGGGSTGAVTDPIPAGYTMTDSSQSAVGESGWAALGTPEAAPVPGLQP